MARSFCLFHNLHKQPLQTMASSNVRALIPVKLNEAATLADSDTFSLQIFCLPFKRETRHKALDSLCVSFKEFALPHFVRWSCLKPAWQVYRVQRRSELSPPNLERVDLFKCRSAGSHSCPDRVAQRSLSLLLLLLHLFHVLL